MHALRSLGRVLTAYRLPLAVRLVSFLVQHRHADCFFERVNKANTDKGRPRPITMVRHVWLWPFIEQFCSRFAVFCLMDGFVPSVLHTRAPWCLLLDVALRKDTRSCLSCFVLNQRRTFFPRSFVEDEKNAVVKSQRGILVLVIVQRTCMIRLLFRTIS